MLQYEDDEMGGLGGYDLVHYDDLAYVASAHQECKYFYMCVVYFNQRLGAAHPKASQKSHFQRFCAKKLKKRKKVSNLE